MLYEKQKLKRACSGFKRELVEARHNHEPPERNVLAEQQAVKLKEDIRILEYRFQQYRKGIEELEREREVNLQLKEQYALLSSGAENAKLLRELSSKLAEELSLLKKRLNLFKTSQLTETAEVKAKSLASEGSATHPTHPKLHKRSHPSFSFQRFIPIDFNPQKLYLSATKIFSGITLIQIIVLSSCLPSCALALFRKLLRSVALQRGSAAK